MKQRRQKEIQKENETYFSLLREVTINRKFCQIYNLYFLHQALPPGPARDDAFNPHPSPKPGMEERISGVKDGLAALAVSAALEAGSAAAAVVDKAGKSPDRPDASPDLARCNGSGSKHLNSSSLSNGSGTGESDFLEQRK